MRKPLHNASNGQETPLEGFDVQASVSQDNTSRIASQGHAKLSIIYGTCCKCGDRPATLKSPSGQSIYCARCGTSRCGIHTIADFVQEASTGLWLDPCCLRHNVQQQSLVEAE